jgi:rhodanese-related sulfurtransferase
MDADLLFAYLFLREEPEELMKARRIFLAAVSLVLIHLFIATVAMSREQVKNEQAKKEKINQMFDGYKRWFFAKAKTITVDEFLELRGREEVVLIDDRSEKERKVSMIPSAISRKEFEDQKETLRDKKIIVYCTIGLRSGQYSQKLMKQGFDAYNLKGGLLSWAHHDQKFFDENGETSRVHVYGRKWSLLPEGYQAIY